MDPGKIPVSAAWYTKLTSLGFTNCLQTDLSDILEHIDAPCWCLQKTNFANEAMMQNVVAIIPVLRKFKHGGSPQTVVARPNNMYTKAWSYAPCGCVYTYAGYRGGNFSTIPSTLPSTLPIDDNRLMQVPSNLNYYGYD